MLGGLQIVPSALMPCTVAAEFWKQIPSSEAFRVVLCDVRDRLYQTRERMRQLLSNGKTEVPEEDTFVSVDQVRHFPASTMMPFLPMIVDLWRSASDFAGLNQLIFL